MLKRLSTTDTEFLSENRRDWISLTATFLLAVSPWHTQISRVAYEANVSLFLVMLAVWLFLNALQQKPYKTLFLTLSGLAFVLTFYTFNSNRVFTPLLVLLIAVLYRKELFTTKQSIRKVLVASLISIAALLPLLPHLASGEGQLRYKEVNIFSSAEVVETSNQRISRLGNAWWANILNNRRILHAQNWIDGYFQHFSGKFLFISGDINPRFSLQDVGQLYIIEMPLLLAGLYLFLSRRKTEHLLILSWLLLAPVPAAFARETPHALRSLNILPTFQIIEAYGLIYILYKCAKIKNHGRFIYNLVITLLAIIFAANMYYYLHNYYVHYPSWTSQEWQYGYKESMEELGKIEGEYDRIVITKGLGRPYIEALFYMKYPPQLFQKERRARTDETGFGFIEVDGFNKYEFRGIDWKKEISSQQSNEKVLVIGTPEEITTTKYAQKIVKGLNGEPVLIISNLPKGTDALIELGILDENGSPI